MIWLILPWSIAIGLLWVLCAAATDDSPILPGALSRRDYPDLGPWHQPASPPAPRKRELVELVNGPQDGVRIEIEPGQLTFGGYSRPDPNAPDLYWRYHEEPAA